MIGLQLRLLTLGPKVARGEVQASQRLLLHQQLPPTRIQKRAASRLAHIALDQLKALQRGCLGGERCCQCLSSCLGQAALLKAQLLEAAQPQQVLLRHRLLLVCPRADGCCEVAHRNAIQLREVQLDQGAVRGKARAQRPDGFRPVEMVDGKGGDARVGSKDGAEASGGGWV